LNQETPHGEQIPFLQYIKKREKESKEKKLPLDAKESRKTKQKSD